MENQRWADQRIPYLLEVPAGIRFLSCEPLLGPLDLSRWLGLEWMDALGDPDTGEEGGWGQEMFAALQGTVGGEIGWVIAGGESGGPWRRALVMDGRIPGHTGDLKPKPEALRWVRDLRNQATVAGVPFYFKQWGGATWRSGGRELDGRPWDEIPEAVPAVGVCAP